MKNIFLLPALVLFLFSCEDKINLENKLDAGDPALVVDAFITNSAEKQKIVLSNTQFFYENTTQKLVSGATVLLKDLTSDSVYTFSETEKGMFFSTINGDSMLFVGHNYQLTVRQDGNEYVSYSTMQRVVPVDSIKFEQAEKFNGTKIDGKYDAELFATDAPGKGDRYWIRFYKNDVRNIEGSNIGVAYESNTSEAGSDNSDGKTFILPLRRFIINSNDEKKKYVDGDKLTIELYSVTNETAGFLERLNTQTNLDGGIFAQPQANLPTNIVAKNSNGKKVVGWFNVSAASKATAIVPNNYYRPKPLN